MDIIIMLRLTLKNILLNKLFNKMKLFFLNLIIRYEISIKLNRVQVKFKLNTNASLSMFFSKAFEMNQRIHKYTNPDSVKQIDLMLVKEYHFDKFMATHKYFIKYFIKALEMFQLLLILCMLIWLARYIIVEFF